MSAMGSYTNSNIVLVLRANGSVKSKEVEMRISILRFSLLLQRGTKKNSSRG
jgi:hypothetical protein